MAKTLLDLGTQPLVNNLCRTAEEAMAAERFPLRAVVEDDLTIHLDYAVEPAKLYQHYLYRSGTSQPYIDHCASMYESFKHLKHDIIIDIGGNDGTLLKTFHAHTKIGNRTRFINVDASESVRKQNEDYGIEFINAYWSDKVDVPKADIIVSTNVFQHTKDIHAFLRGIQKHLDGVWILEFPYTLETICTGQFDQFYHEHYYYWLLSPLEKLFKQYGLKIIHALPQDIHGGTMRLWMTNREPSAPAMDLSRYTKYEQDAVDGAFFEAAIESIGDQFIYDLAHDNLGKVCFFGAAAKGCVFLNALGLNIDTVGEMVVIDDTPEKQGLYVPGTGFQVVDRSVLPEYDTVVILAHNFKEHIMKSLAREWSGRIISFLPVMP